MFVYIVRKSNQSVGWAVVPFVLAHPTGGLTKRVGTLSAE